MKKIMTLLFILCTVFSFSETVSEKRIQVRGTATKEIAPNSAKIYLQITTQNENLEKAGKENADILARYKNLLNRTNAKYEKIESTGYNTYKNYNWEYVTVDKGKKEFSTVLTVEVSSFSLNLLKNFMTVLTQENIYNTGKTKNGNYYFTVTAKDLDNRRSYQKAVNNFNNIQKKLIAGGFDGNNIKITGYDNKEINLETGKNVKKELFTVTHSIEVKTRDMQKLGNIINLAHSLEMKSTGVIEYDVDNRQKIEDQLYEEAYREALKKAQNILDKTELKLKKPVTITDNSNNEIRTFYSYYNGNYNTNSGSEILKESDTKLIEKSQQNAIIINPQKSTFSKTVYIEFEMN